MIIIEEFAVDFRGIETQLCLGRAVLQSLGTLAPLLLYAVVVNVLVIYKQQFYLHQYIFETIRNGAVCTPTWLLYCVNMLTVPKGM